MKVYWIILDALPMAVLKGTGGEVTSDAWEAFLQESCCYQNTFAQATWTYPSFAWVYCTTCSVLNESIWCSRL